jgi:hypothetical protein
MATRVQNSVNLIRCEEIPTDENPSDHLTSENFEKHPAQSLKGGASTNFMTDDATTVWIFVMKTRATLHISIKRIVNLNLTLYDTRESIESPLKRKTIRNQVRTIEDQ